MDNNIKLIAEARKLLNESDSDELRDAHEALDITLEITQTVFNNWLEDFIKAALDKPYTESRYYKGTPKERFEKYLKALKGFCDDHRLDKVWRGFSTVYGTKADMKQYGIRL